MTENFTWKIEKKDRLDLFLRTELPLKVKSEISNSKLRRLIIAGSVYVNGKQIRVPSYELRSGSVISADIDTEKLFYEKQPDDIDYVLTEKDVLYEDDSIILVNKPAFLPTEGTIVETRQSMHSAVVKYLWSKNPSLRNPPYAGIMHRLDRETSGVLLFTKTRAVNNAVHKMFEEHSAKKNYRAVCENLSGKKILRNFTVENYIGRISSKSARCTIGILPESKGGQYSKTDFSVSAEKNGFVYIDCFLHTGRTHQIRVHLSSKGLPIVGDELYGSSKKIPESNGRIMLHAFSLEFSHPLTGETLKVCAPLPEFFC